MLKPPLRCLTLAALGLLALASVIGCTGTNSGRNLYSDEQLKTWIEIVRDAVDNVPAYSGSGIGFRNMDDRRIRIQLRAYPLRGARKAMEDAISTVDVPRDAIVLDIGCEPYEPSSFYTAVSSHEFLPKKIAFSIKIPQHTSYGEAVPMTLTLENISNEPLGFHLAGGMPEEFVVANSVGESVWHWGCGKGEIRPIRFRALEPGEKLIYTGEWEQVNHMGEPVAPGDYLIYGTLHIGSYEYQGDKIFQLETNRYQLRILKPKTR